MAWRARYFLIGGVALITAVGPIGWQFLGGRGEVLKSDGGPIVTVMDFGPSFPLDPLTSGWRHRKFWTRSPMTMASASRAGCRACASKPATAPRCCFARSISISPPIRCSPGAGSSNCRSRARSTSARAKADDHPARLFLRFITDRGEKRAMEVIWGNRLKPGTINTSAAFRTLSPMPATIGSAAGSTRGSISSASMPRSGRMPHPRTWSMSPCSAIATTAHRQHQLLRLCSARTAVRFWRPDALGARPGV